MTETKFPPPIDLEAIRAQFSELFARGKWFPNGHECGPYVALANQVQPLLRHVDELRAENERLQAERQGWADTFAQNMQVIGAENERLRGYLKHLIGEAQDRDDLKLMDEIWAVLGNHKEC